MLVPSAFLLAYIRTNWRQRFQYIQQSSRKHGPTDATFLWEVTKGAREPILTDARLQIGDSTIILANGQRFTIFLYVIHMSENDDLVILSPSVKGLQKLLNICSEYGEEHDIMFNQKKTECMYFPVKGRALINIPKVFLNAHLLRWVTKYKYLGIILTDDLSDYV